MFENHELLILPLILECSAFTGCFSIFLHCKSHTKTSQIEILFVCTLAGLRISFKRESHHFISQRTVSFSSPFLDRLIRRRSALLKLVLWHFGKFYCSTHLKNIDNYS